MINLNNKAVVIDHLNNLQDYELLDLYSEYADQNSYERVYNLDEDTINDVYDSPWSALNDSNHDKFNENDSYFTYNGYGHMVTFNYPSDDNSPIDIEDIAEWIISNDLHTDYHIEVVNEDDKMELIADYLETCSPIIYQELVNLLDIDYHSDEDKLADSYYGFVIDDINDHIQYDTPLLNSVLIHLKLAE